MNRLWSTTAGEDISPPHFMVPASAGEVTSQPHDSKVPPADEPRGWVRSTAESVLAAVMLAAALPVLAAAALLIKLTSRGPVIYSQSRLGRGGRRFVIYKLRTMRHNCEATSGIRWATRGDARVTRVGRLLRATHLDELPQLVNVIRGDMSLIGPRPERPEIVAALIKSVPDYPRRHRVRPGVTGLAQIQLPADTDVASVRRKLTLDLVYIRERTVWLDTRIVAGTLLKVVGVPFPRIRAILGLPVALADETVLDHPDLEVVTPA
jgi:lipopolysaccharide/colanic/teichoic acid biosynthesis glycosyltransferase